MAVMGVRINGGGGGIDTSLADTLAKALFGDPEREMKLALGQSNLQTDEFQRQQIQSAIAQNEAQRQAIAEKAARDQAVHDALTASGHIRGQEIYDTQSIGGDQPVPVDVAEQPGTPLPVTATGDYPAPIDLPEFTGAMDNPPIVLPDMPAPIHDAEVVPPISSDARDHQIGTERDALGAGTGDPVITFNRGVPAVKEDRLQPPPQPLAEGDPRFGGPSPLAAGDPRFGGPLDDQVAGGLDMPAPISIGDEAEPIDNPAEEAIDTGTTGALDDGTVQLPDSVPMTPMPRPGETIDNGDGTVTHGAVNGPVRLTREQADALGLAAAYSNDPAGQTAKEAGTAGVIYNPNSKLSVDEKIATLIGNSPSKDSVAATAGDPTSPGAYTGTGIEAQDQNTIVSVGGAIANGQPVTPEQARNYGLAWGRQFGTPKMQRVQDPDGTLRDVPVMPYVPPGTPTPQEVNAAAGITAAAPQASPPAAAAAAGGTGAQPAAADAAGGATAAQPPAAAGGGAGAGGYVVKNPESKVPTNEKAAQMRMNLDQLALTEKTIGAVTPEDVNGAMAFVDQFLNQGTGMVNLDLALQSLPPPEKRSQAQAALSWVMNKLRVESGATIQPSEIDKEFRASIPIFGDQQQQLDEKRTKRMTVAKSWLREGFGPTPEGKAAQERILRDFGIDLSEQPAAAAAGNTGGSNTGATPKRRKLVNGKLVEVQ